ncbi:MAG: glycine oxidase ThiO [Actinobacteria bacterium]|nr:glycine oxidase ThiO [Actinomycetota bacterium]
MPGPMTADVVVVGGGVIGLGIAWRCRQRGLDVLVVDPAPGSGASRTAAGMLTPVTELNYDEEDLLRLGIESARRYPAFVDELQQATRTDLSYRRTGTVAAAWDSADLAGLADLNALHHRLGLNAELVSGRELRSLEPLLAPGLPGGLFAAEDHQVDNRRLHQALLALQPKIVHREVTQLIEQDDRIVGVSLDDGSSVGGATTVLAAGAWSARLDPTIGVRPVKGQTIRLHSSELFAHVIRAAIKGSSVYVAQRAHGEIVVGASSEEAGFDMIARTGPVYELLRDAQSVLPSLSEAEFVEVSTSLRPGSLDNAPVLGRAPRDGLVHASGHYRNGILLTPVTADTIAELVATGVTPELLVPFTGHRFTRASA